MSEQKQRTDVNEDAALLWKMRAWDMKRRLDELQGGSAEWRDVAERSFMKQAEPATCPDCSSNVKSVRGKRYSESEVYYCMSKWHTRMSFYKGTDILGNPVFEEDELCLNEDCDSNHICFQRKGHTTPCYVAQPASSSISTEQTFEEVWNKFVAANNVEEWKASDIALWFWNAAKGTK